MEISVSMMLSGIIDIFDGYIAGKFKRNAEEKRFGVELDSILDTINFGVFPLFYIFYLLSDLKVVIEAGLLVATLMDG